MTPRLPLMLALFAFGAQASAAMADSNAEGPAILPVGQIATTKSLVWQGRARKTDRAFLLKDYIIKTPPHSALSYRFVVTHFDGSKDTFPAEDGWNLNINHRFSGDLDLEIIRKTDDLSRPVDLYIVWHITPAGEAHLPGHEDVAPQVRPPSKEPIRRLADGRYLVQVKDVEVALTQENPMATHTYFGISDPPADIGRFGFSLTDLLRDPDRYIPKLRTSARSSVTAHLTSARFDEINGVPVAKGVTSVSVYSGANVNCEAWKAEWARLRGEAVGMTADQYGWIRHDVHDGTGSSTFIKFIGNANRAAGRFYGVSCDFSGACQVSACHNGLTAGISIYSSDKIQGEDYQVKNFDRQIASGIKVLQNMVVGKSIDVSQP